MDNNAFKDLVRTHNTKTDEAASSSSTKAIARRAVEEEFRTRKKRKRGGGYASSSDDDDDEAKDGKDHRKKGQKGKKNDADEDAAEREAVRKDLSERYRDRAKERREGGGIDSSGNNSNSNSSNAHLLLVPHGKKGLDLALLRKERKRLRKKEEDSGAANANANAPTTKPPSNFDGVRSGIPSMHEAHRILRECLESVDGNGNGNSSDDPVSGKAFPSAPMVEYLRELLRWKALDPAAWDGTSTQTAAGGLAGRTSYALAIDGDPRDTERAWEVPRALAARGGTTEGHKGRSWLPVGEQRAVEAVFARRTSVRAKLLSSLPEQGGGGVPNESPGPKKAGNKVDDYFNDESDSNGDGDDDDDMFGGLDD